VVVLPLSVFVHTLLKSACVVQVSVTPEALVSTRTTLPDWKVVVQTLVF
jgi:hypothetical protein